MTNNESVTNQEIKPEEPVAERVTQFLDIEGERIRQETERIQSPIIAKARMEYKQRLAAFLEDESSRMKAEAEKEAAAIMNKARSEASLIREQVQNEKNTVISEAQKQAKQLIETIKQQAVQEKERIVSNGRQQAEAILAAARENAAKISADAAESAKKTADAECERILTEARNRAHDQSQTIISDSWHRAQQMLDSAEAAYNLVRSQLQNCIKAIIEADSSMEIAVSQDSDGGQDENLFDIMTQNPEPVAEGNK